MNEEKQAQELVNIFGKELAIKCIDVVLSNSLGIIKYLNEDGSELEENEIEYWENVKKIIWRSIYE